jgi:hypothetical protein
LSPCWLLPLLLLRSDQRPLSSLYEEGFRSLFENEVDTLPRKEVVVRRIRHMMGANTRKASAAQDGPQKQLQAFSDAIAPDTRR